MLRCVGRPLLAFVNDVHLLVVLLQEENFLVLVWLPRAAQSPLVGNLRVLLNQHR